MNQNQLLDSLSKTFGKENVPNRDLILKDRKCNFRECEDALRIFSGRQWSEVRADSLFNKDDSLYQLSSAAFLYYIPSFLVALIQDYWELDATADSIIRLLTPVISHGQLRESWADSWYTKLDLASKELIKITFIFIRDKHGSIPAERALNLFWNNPL